MNPSLTNISEEENNILKFTLSGINVSLANAIRRTMLSDIPVVGFYTETHENNDCHIDVNTGRLHNEILKHRLSCIPVHSDDLTVLPKNYILEVDEKNASESVSFITTEHFKIKNVSNGNYLTQEETKKIFPPNDKTGMYIDFARLRPQISQQLPGEHIKLRSEFTVHTAKENSVYNVVSKCAYSNTPDMVKIQSAWEEQEDKLRSEEMTQQDISFQKKNFYLLDAQRHFVENSFDFIIQSVGVYENKDVVMKACLILQNKFADMVQNLDSDIVPINVSESTMDNCYDVVLENEDYTIGKSLEFFLYSQYFETDKILTFCGFKKFHPHDDNSKIRLAFKDSLDKKMVNMYLRKSCVDAAELFKKVYDAFH
jgi:DNA-directed RNA polymerase II subunit RPB3